MKKILLVVFLLLFLMIGSEQAQAAGLVPCGGTGETSCGFCDFFKLISNVLNFVIKMAMVVATLMLVVGGIYFFFAGGNPGALETGKKIITSTIWGLVIIFSAFLIVGTVLSAIGLTDWTQNIYKNWWERGFWQPNCSTIPTTNNITTGSSDSGAQQIPTFNTMPPSEASTQVLGSLQAGTDVNLTWNADEAKSAIKRLGGVNASNKVVVGINRNQVALNSYYTLDNTGSAKFYIPGNLPPGEGYSLSIYAISPTAIYQTPLFTLTPPESIATPEEPFLPAGSELKINLPSGLATQFPLMGKPVPSENIIGKYKIGEVYRITWDRTEITGNSAYLKMLCGRHDDFGNVVFHITISAIPNTGSFETRINYECPGTTALPGGRLFIIDNKTNNIKLRSGFFQLVK